MALSTWLLLAVAVLLRLGVGLHPYSGAGTPPKYGDYEAQRHWMEVTIHTPVATWYTESEHNSHTYWPLDYPPLSAYQSWLYGKAIAYFVPEAMELGTSRGYETYYSKLLMRWSVVLSDILVFFPAAILCAHAFTRGHPAPTRPAARLLILTAALLQPASVLIDHGHFQYNCISLGLAAAAAAAIADGRDVIGSVLFCLSLNHKQMGLFFAPAFFAHLLGKCLQHKGAVNKVLAVGKLGVSVVATFAACWAPYLGSPAEVLQVVRRILPVHRGLYEDYVANFWCATSVLVKWKDALPQPALVRLCAAATLLAAGPSMAHQMARPSRRGLLHGLANSGLAFFMFAYHVHEKSILLPLLPITLLAAEYPTLAAVLPPVAAFSMYPLLVRDGLAVAYLAAIMLYIAAVLWVRDHVAAVCGTTGVQAGSVGDVKGKGARGSGLWCRVWERVEAGVARWKGVMVVAVGLGLAGLHVAKEVLPPPERYKWLYDRAFITLSYGVFVAVMVYLNVQQWRLPVEGTTGVVGRAAMKKNGRKRD